MSPFEDVPACGNGAAQPGGCGSGRRPRLRCRPWVRPGFGGFLGLASRVLLCMTIPLGRSFPSRPSFFLALTSHAAATSSAEHITSFYDTVWQWHYWFFKPVVRIWRNKLTFASSFSFFSAEIWKQKGMCIITPIETYKNFKLFRCCFWIMNLGFRDQKAK